MRGEFVDLDDARLYYYAAGSRGAGEPIVFLHGFATSGHLWAEVVPLLPAGHRVVVLDLLGFGRSDPPGARALTLRAHAERVVQLLDALSIPRACIVGHGLGGGVAQSLAVHWSDRVARLALVGSIAFGGWRTREVLVARATLPITRHLPPAWLLSMVRAELERGYSDAARAAHSIDKFLRPFASEDGRRALARHIAALDGRETASLGAALSSLRLPSTVIWGAHDPLLPVDLGRSLAAAIPQATFALLPDGSHFLPEECPRPLADAIGDLLRR